MIEADVSSTIADTIRRNGFNLVRDGSSMRLAIENTPPIPSRKTRVEIINNGNIKNAIEFLNGDEVRRDDVS